MSLIKLGPLSFSALSSLSYDVSSRALLAPVAPRSSRAVPSRFVLSPLPDNLVAGRSAPLWRSLSLRATVWRFVARAAPNQGGPKSARVEPGGMSCLFWRARARDFCRAQKNTTAQLSEQKRGRRRRTCEPGEPSIISAGATRREQSARTSRFFSWRRRLRVLAFCCRFN